MERLVYRSRATPPGPAFALSGILAASILNNARADVTGALGFSGDMYVQLLEGSGEALDALMARLGADPRHTDVDVLYREPAASRLLPGWNMAKVDLAAAWPDIGRLLTARDGLALTGRLAALVHGHPEALA